MSIGMGSLGEEAISDQRSRVLTLDTTIAWTLIAVFVVKTVLHTWMDEVPEVFGDQ